MDKIIDIQKGHTLSDYRRFFAYEYDKGIALAFKKSEMKYMNPERQYWEIKNEQGEIKYYELPKHVKPFTMFSPYCFNRVFHRRPARNAMLIVGSIAVASITCSFIGKTYFGRKDFDIDVKTTDLKKASIAYQQWRYNHKNDDVSKSGQEVFTIANWAMGQTLFDATIEDAIPKKNMMTIGHGHSDTNILITHVLVDISNCFVQEYENDTLKAMEESISFGTMSLTRFAKRDYYNFDLNQKEVTAYHGDVKSSSTANWNDKIIKTFPTEADYSAEAGKCPYQPFLYNISEETVLTDKVFDEDPNTGAKHFGNSKCVSNKDKDGKITGYTIDLDLHNVKGVTRYVKRMTYLSGQTPDYFKSIHMKFVTDEDLRLISSYVNEDYSVTLMNSSGWMDTRYYYENSGVTLRNIPNHSESIDYNKYPFN